jgi:membrane carboxypeptidase/penicillin-binding protein PbpC
MQEMNFLLQILLLAQHVSGHLYAHHQELRSPQTGHTTLNSTLYRQLENQAQNTTGSNHLYNTIELLMMGIKVPETC